MQLLEDRDPGNAIDTTAAPNFSAILFLLPRSDIDQLLKDRGDK